MTRFKQVREAARNLAVRATGDDGEEAKLNDLPSDQSQQDDADENNRNPDGSAEDQVEKSIKPIYTKTENGIYTLNTESVDEKKAARLAKIARAAAAREKDQAAQKEKAKQKHYAASAKSRKAIDYFKKGGNKDQFGRVREDIEQVDEYKSQYEEVEQTDESLRPASRSGIKDKFVHKEGLEQKLAKISESKDAVEIEITENTIDDIKKLTTLSQAGTVRFADGSSAKVSPQSATALLQTHGNLNTNNQKKFAKKLASSASEFAKLEKFALQQAKLTGRLYALNDL
jgi:hypothetical protein